MSYYNYSLRQSELYIDRSDKTGNSNYYSQWLSNILVLLSLFLIIATFPISLLFCTRMIKEYERAVIFRLGCCFEKIKGPGIIFILPCLDTYEKVDTRTVVIEVKPQEILTRDSVTIRVDAIIFFRVFDPYLALNKISNVQYGTRLLAASTLRNTLGTRTLKQILKEKDTLADMMQEMLNLTTNEWGSIVERIEIKDIKLPLHLQKAMASEAEATREAIANVIIAKGEKEASISLKKAADLLGKNPVAMHLRYLQALSQIATENTSTIVFPIPIELNNYLSSNN
ncbi:unnamed protein product [Brachionus calyciflorus]|uniref:Band 7 domain-containing protein n=1 Tax=Brachionus calyciflorus TaxID=104777 RepID=A0A813TWR9_9BILA|nr:unnamed protein product [Brachionus calyciflorus]